VKVLYHLFVNGIPRAQSRPRLGQYGNFYSNSSEVKAWKAQIEAAFLPCRRPTIVGPVILRVCFYLPRPKKMKNAGNSLNVPHTKRPDTDNLLKAVMDSMSDVGVWKDDAQVYRTDAGKYYADRKPGAQIIVEGE